MELALCIKLTTLHWQQIIESIIAAHLIYSVALLIILSIIMFGWMDSLGFFPRFLKNCIIHATAMQRCRRERGRGGATLPD